MRYAPMASLANPVARAVQLRRIETTVRDFTIRLHLLADREYVAADGLAVARALMVGFELMVLAGKADSPDARVIGGATSAVAQLAQRRWSWRRVDANAIDAGLKRAADQVRAAKPGDLDRAWAKVEALGREPAGGFA